MIISSESESLIEFHQVKCLFNNYCALQQIDNNNCNLNLTMTKPQRSINFQLPFSKTERLTSVEKMMQNHNDPHLICYVPHQQTETEEDLYEFEIAQSKKGTRGQAREPTQQEARQNIEMTIILVNQNDELLHKIEQIKKYINEEELKSKIFKKKAEENQKLITHLKDQKLKLSQESSKIKTLNESSIPNKSLELSTTLNTNAWLGDFFNKSQLESLWATKQKVKQEKSVESKVKSYTIDLSSFMHSARLKNERNSEKTKANDTKYFQEKLKPRSSAKPPANRVNNKTNNKVELCEKQRLLNKNLSQLRNLKKNKCNPEL